MSSLDPPFEKFRGPWGDGLRSAGPNEDEKIGDGIKLGKAPEVGRGSGDVIGMFGGDIRGDPGKVYIESELSFFCLLDLY